MAGSSTADAPQFFFDLGVPEGYLVAERILALMPVPCEWVPVLDAGLPGGGWGARRSAEERATELGEIERTAAARGLQPVRWPAGLPFDSTLAMRATTYAKGAGKTVAFALAAFRQAYAGGRDLSVPDNVLIAASACEMHPAAILRAVETRGVRDALARATALAAQRGVRSTPALWTPSSVHHGDAALEDAAAVLAERAA
jgi:2-hydroxychromene-2-carboxylate isomerase